MFHYTDDDRDALLKAFGQVRVDAVSERQLDIYLDLKASKPLDLTMADVTGLWILFANATADPAPL